MPLRQFLLRVASKPGVEHLADLGVLLQPGGQFSRVFGMTLHAQREGLEPAQGQITVEGPRHRADGVLQVAELFGQFWVVANNEHAAHHVRVAIEVFGGRMHHQIKAQLQRPLMPGGSEGVVCRSEDAPRLGQFRYRGQVR